MYQGKKIYEDYIRMVKNNKIKNMLIPSIVFVFSSIILFINNLTQFFSIYKINLNINLVSWLGIILSLFWWAYLFGKKQKIW